MVEKISVLVVDDNADYRSTIQYFLDNAGFDVKTAANPKEAIEAIIQSPFDMAIIDIRLSNDFDEDDLSGLHLAMTFRGLNPKSKIFILSGHKLSKKLQQPLRYVGVSYISKSDNWYEYLPDKLTQTLSEPQHSGIHDDFSYFHITLDKEHPSTVRSRGHYAYSAFGKNNENQEKISRFSESTRRAIKHTEDLDYQARDIGERLWKDIFEENSSIGSAYLAARSKSQYLSLIFEGPKEMLQLPLEFLRNSETQEMLAIKHPIVRFIRGVGAKREAISPRDLQLAGKNKLKILIIASNTEPAIPGVDREVEDLALFFRDQQYIDQEDLEITLIPTGSASFNFVKQEISNPKYDIIHYAGHGAFDNKHPEKSSLYFWSNKDKKGGVIPMTAKQLCSILEYTNVRFFFLSCCSGNKFGEASRLLTHDFLGLADAIIQAGVPSVLGYRWPVSDVGARKLTRAFYESLLKQGSADIALWEARREIYENDDDIETWLSPILICQQ